MNSYRLVEFKELDSTNLFARRNIRDLQDRDVIQAHAQTAGRGRGQRNWISHIPGNLCLSSVLKPLGDLPQLPLANLSQLLAVCACRVFDRFQTHAEIKWPNDILVRRRKIGGILAETVIQGNRLVGMILGIGINLNLPPEILSSIEQPATALNLLQGRDVDVASFRDALLLEFFSNYDAFLSRGFPMIQAEFIDRFLHLGNPIQVRSAAGLISGTANGVSREGALQVLESNGILRTVTIGEMFPA